MDNEARGWEQLNNWRFTRREESKDEVVQHRKPTLGDEMKLTTIGTGNPLPATGCN